MTTRRTFVTAAGAAAFGWAPGARAQGAPTVLGMPVISRVVDGVQRGFWETYQFVQSVVVVLVDEKLLNGLEDGVDQTLNAPRRTPDDGGGGLPG